jgi:hypothetical protein
VDKFEIAMRLKVMNPPKGVTMKVQKGRDELLEPSRTSTKALIFDFPVTVDLSNGTPNFLGKFVQGPKTARFVYVNSGKYAGQSDSCWGRRAKISLIGISAEQVREGLKWGNTRFELSFEATGGRDGGPVCGTIRSVGIGWQIIKQ